jgi:phospholipase/lecithinase/hemolysin
MRLARVVLLLAAFAVGTSTSSGRVLPSFDAMFVFGDSLSDLGNDFIGTRALGIVPAIPPSTTPNRAYFNGRFSNGPVAVEYLWFLLSQRPPMTTGALKPFLGSPAIPSRGGLSFAFGGTGTGLITDLGGFTAPGLTGQVALFAAADRLRNAPSRSLYVVFAGANDYLTPTEPPSIDRTVGNIIRAVRVLYLTGARDIMVLNLPDLGAVPMVAQDPPTSQLLSVLSQQHNALLLQALVALRLPGLRLYPVDINQALALLPGGINTQVPALDALVPVPPPGLPATSLCLFLSPGSCPDVPTFDIGATFFYWDVQHPTTAVHQALGQHLYNSLN